MQRIKISLTKDGIFSVPCSTVFMKHIEGYMCRTEINLDERVEGRLDEFYKKREKESDIKIDTNDIKTRSGEKFPFNYLHILNFHQKKDLPFTNYSVYKYAERFFNFAINDPNAVKVATAIHGPGAGLDASEAMEVMLDALANQKPAGNLQEILFIEKDPEVFERLKSRMKYLEEDKGLIKTEGDDVFLQTAESTNESDLAEKLKQLAAESFFIAMPFHEDFEDIYRYGIKKSIEDIGRKPERLDYENFTGDIVERIKKRIPLSRLVVADITGNNPNVFYEVGYAHGVNKPVVLISQELDLPFDLRTHRCITYNPKQIYKLETDLKNHLEEILKNQ